MNDLVIDELRRVRLEISHEIGSNFDAMIDRYAQLQSRFTKLPLTLKDRRTKDCTGAEDNAVSGGESSSVAR